MGQALCRVEKQRTREGDQAISASVWELANWPRQMTAYIIAGDVSYFGLLQIDARTRTRGDNCSRSATIDEVRAAADTVLTRPKHITVMNANYARVEWSA